MGAHVAVGQDRLGAVAVDGVLQPRGHPIERLVPRDLLERSRPLGAGADQRVQQPILGIDPRRVVGDLAAEEARGDRLVGVAFDLHGPPVGVDVDEHGARIGTVVGASPVHHAPGGHRAKSNLARRGPHRTPPHRPLRARHRGLAGGGARPSLRRHRPALPQGAGRPQPVQRGRDRPAGGRRARPLPARRGDLRELAPAGRAGSGARAGDLGPGAVVHHARRRAAHPPRRLRPRARRGLRPRPHPPSRAHPPGPQGGPAAPDPRHAGQPLPRLQPVHRPRRRHPGDRRGPGQRRPVGPGPRRRGHRQHAVADRRPDRDLGADRRPGHLGAADRRRPPSLRDRAGLRRGGRRRGPAPLRADAAVLAGRPRPGRLPHPPAAHRPQGRHRQAAGHPRGADHPLRGRAGRRPGPAGHRPRRPSATWTPSTASPTAPR